MSESITKEFNTQEFVKRDYPRTCAEILKELQNVYAGSVHPSQNEVSIYDVMMLLRSTHLKIEEQKERYEESMSSKAGYSFGEGFVINVVDFDYGKEELKIKIVNCHHYFVRAIDERKKSEENYLLKKVNGKLVIDDAGQNLSTYKANILPLFGRNLSDLYDFYMSYKQAFTQKSSNIIPINSGFTVDIDKFKVRLFIKNDIFNGTFDADFELLYMASIHEFKLWRDSIEVEKLLDGRKSELFQRIFINIDDCPEWMRPILKHQKREQCEIEQDKQAGKLKQKKTHY